VRRLGALLLLVFALAQAPTIAAALTEADLADVSLRPPPGAVVPGGLIFSDDGGRRVMLGDVMRDRPTLLVLADYDCHLICGPILAATAATILRSGLVAGRDFNLVVVGINPMATHADAAKMKADQLGGDAGLEAAAYFLEGDASTIQALSQAIGYHARYDADARRFAHPTDLLALTHDRRVSRLAPGLSVDPGELRSALVEAGGGFIVSLIDRVHVLCYGLDPTHGEYDEPVRIALMGAGGATLAALGAAALFAHRRRGRLTDGARP
jgi:protein SCO1